MQNEKCIDVSTKDCVASKIIKELMSHVIKLRHEYPFAVSGYEYPYPKELMSSFIEYISKSSAVDVDIDEGNIFQITIYGLTVDYPRLMAEYRELDLHTLNILLNDCIIPNIVDLHFKLSEEILPYTDTELEKEAREYLVEYNIGEKFAVNQIPTDARLIMMPNKRLMAFQYYLKIHNVQDVDIRDTAISIVKNAAIRNSIMYILHRVKACT